LGSGAIADGETDAKNASVDGPIMSHLNEHFPDCLRCGRVSHSVVVVHEAKASCVAPNVKTLNCAFAKF
jgi:hypothetical protein